VRNAPSQSRASPARCRVRQSRASEDASCGPEPGLIKGDTSRCLEPGQRMHVVAQSRAGGDRSRLPEPDQKRCQTCLAHQRRAKGGRISAGWPGRGGGGPVRADPIYRVEL